MNHAILLTGIAGSGKSAVCAALARLGHPAFDIEDVDGLFTMYDKATGRPFVDYDNDDLAKVERGSWICDKEKLKELIDQNSARVTFYCGVASNQDEIWPMFDQVILLRAAPATIRHRLATRTSNDFGRTAEVQDRVLGYQDWWEQKAIKQDALVIDADRPLSEVTAEIITMIEDKSAS